MAYEYKGNANDNTEIAVIGDAVVNVVIGALPKTEWRRKTTDAIPVAAREIGLITEDGETLTRSVDITTINSHQGSNQRSFTNNGTMSFSFAAQQFNEIVKELWLGSAADAVDGFTDVAMDGGITATIFYDAWDIHNGFERHITIDGTGLFTPNGDLTFAKAAEANFPLTFTFNGQPRFNDARTVDEEDTGV